MLAPELDRQYVLDEFNRNDINCVFHYVPLHSSPFGLRCSRTHGTLEVTAAQSERLIRLPIWLGLRQEQQQRVVNVLKNVKVILSK